ncbi:unnamed protein product [Bursaphelenchus xylophilus]|uniref:(pine wood nematode) hypothetical protein n=1 Tax=Bursaphelenchus xylophilus TaxID=6326 RepID=A0A1I7RTW1_BURXY|nr:unnamed protein product [Bursaphelenchus xylophilus]CAG9132147.1 unnamed protein product [Bursaphelenchus xylophilus]
MGLFQMPTANQKPFSSLLCWWAILRFLLSLLQRGHENTVLDEKLFIQFTSCLSWGLILAVLFLVFDGSNRPYSNYTQFSAVLLLNIGAITFYAASLSFKIYDHFDEFVKMPNIFQAFVVVALLVYYSCLISLAQIYLSIPHFAKQKFEYAKLVEIKSVKVVEP